VHRAAWQQPSLNLSLVRNEGIEPPSPGPKPAVFPLHQFHVAETGLEPVAPDYEPGMLPLHYSAIVQGDGILKAYPRRRVSPFSFIPPKDP
jgi:hypothetical protein